MTRDELLKMACNGLSARRRAIAVAIIDAVFEDYKNGLLDQSASVAGTAREVS